MGWLRGLTAAVAVAAAIVAAACGQEDTRPAELWTAQQAAASIVSVRGLPVRVLWCRGLGTRASEAAAANFRRFACLAGARRPGEQFDTVAVTYVLRPLGPYEGAGSKVVLSDVHFIGGPGVP